MKIFISFFLFSISVCNLEANGIDSLKLNGIHLLYHKEHSDQNIKKGLIIYMHGGVSQFKNNTKTVALTADNLLEGNETFLPTFLNEGYDIIFPIAHREYNWLEEAGEKYIHSLYEKYAKKYEKIYLAGFSDGGTGAYRFFYRSPELYDGVLIFNGYPQADNFQKEVDYSSVIDKKVFFFSSRSDQLIPYEFLLLEFRRQQMVNKHTYFKLIDGKHTFKAYQKEEFNIIINVLNMPKELLEFTTDSMLVYPPFDGWIKDGTLTELYPFRKKIGKAYNMNEVAYLRDDYSLSSYTKLLSKGSKIIVQPTTVSKEELLDLKKIKYNIIQEGKQDSIQLINWLNTPVW